MSSLAKIPPPPWATTTGTGLRSLAARFSQPVSVAENRHPHQDSHTLGDRLGTVLYSLDEVVLPRLISVLCDNGRCVGLVVANRRLICVFPGGDASKRIEANSADPEFVLDQLKHLLRDTTSSRIQCARTRMDFGQCQSGLPISALINTAALDRPAPAIADPIEVLLGAFSNQMPAWVRLDPVGHTQQLGGDPLWRARLVALAEEGLADIEAQLAQTLSRPDQTGCILLPAGNAQGVMLVYARSPSAGFLALLPNCALTDFQTAWRAVV